MSSQKPPHQPLHILIAEDEPVISNLLSDHLGIEGFVVTLASNGKEALDLARAHRPDIIVSDLSMPGLDGFGLIKAVRADDQLRHIPIIVHSVMFENEHRQKALALGATAFLTKPTQIKEIIQTIYSCL